MLRVVVTVVLLVLIQRQGSPGPYCVCMISVLISWWGFSDALVSTHSPKHVARLGYTRRCRIVPQIPSQNIVVPIPCPKESQTCVNFIATKNHSLINTTFKTKLHIQEKRKKNISGSAVCGVLHLQKNTASSNQPGDLMSMACEKKTTQTHGEHAN